MYVCLYLHPVPAENADAFLAAVRAAGRIYLEHGATAVEVYEATDLAPAYGCAGLAQCLDARPDERVFLGMDRFLDRSHRDRVLAGIDADDRIGLLYEEVAGLTDLARVVRGEFEDPA